MSEATSGDQSSLSFCGTQVRLRSMDAAPRNGTGILVLLEKESLGRVWHSAVIKPNISIVGHHFAFDCPKMLGWIPLPALEIAKDDTVLLPCPFCGGSNIGFSWIESYSLDSSYGTFGCRDCDANFRTEQNSVSFCDIQRWNTRNCQ